MNSSTKSLISKLNASISKFKSIYKETSLRINELIFKPALTTSMHRH